MDSTGNGAGYRRTRLSASAAIVASSLVLASCALVLPSQTGRTTKQLPVGQGAVQHFPLSRGNVDLLLSPSRNLALMVSASGSAPTAFQFRVQQAAGMPAGDTRFLTWPRVAASESAPVRRVQDVPLQKGYKTNFWINTGFPAPAGDCFRTASLQYWSNHAYFFVDSGPASGRAQSEVCNKPAAPAPADEQLRGLAAAFEGESPLSGAQPIYDTVTRLFGQIPNNGVDNDPRVFIVISPAVERWGEQKGLMGYFYGRDIESGDAHSNQRDAIFLTSQIFNQKPYTTFGTLAHEFTHLTVHYQRPKTAAVESWWDEGLAMFSMDRAGYGLPARNEDIAKDIKAFLDKPAAYSLTDWAGNPCGDRECPGGQQGFAYGLSYLYARYLHDRFGAGLVLGITRGEDNTVTGIDKALRAQGFTFEQVYSDFMVAIYTSGTLLQVEPRYRLNADLNLRADYGPQLALAGPQARRVGSFGQIQSTAVRPWGTAFFELGQEAANQWTFSFSVPSALFGSAVGW